MEIKVFGPDCSRCTETENIVRAAIQETGLPARVEKITDLKAMKANLENIRAAFGPKAARA